MSNIKIGYIGMTHLGIIYGITSALKGYKVVCYDENKKLIDNLSKGRFEIKEPDLNKNFKKGLKNIIFTSEIKNLKNLDLIFLSFDTPINQKGEGNYNQLKSFLKKLIRNNLNHICTIILSQVYPGFTNSIKEFNEIYYQVETLIFGNAFQASLYPERIIIGKKNDKLNTKLKSYLKSFKCEIIETDIEGAELTKIAINAYLVSSIITTNYLSQISEKLKTNWSFIEKSIRSDPRIGKHAYVSSSLGFGGTNLLRDIRTLIQISDKFKISNRLPKTWIKENQIRGKWLRNIMSSIKYNKNKIGVLGLSYKENTQSISNSLSIDLIKSNKDHFFYLYDPNVNEDIFYQKNVKYCATINELLANCKLLIIANKSQEFIDLKENEISKVFSGKQIIDPFNVLKIKNKNLFSVYNLV